MKMHSAKLISITPDAEQTCIYCARVSNPNNQDNPEYSKLVKYLIKQKHWSPFEMANMVLEINTTRSVSPQILRHRSFSFQEFSQRYANATDLMLLNRDLMTTMIRSQDFKNKQVSNDNMEENLKKELVEVMYNSYNSSITAYEKLIASGVAKECAREVLPMATPTRLYMNGTLRSWITYIALREKNGTQLEHQKIALSCKKILSQECPIISDALGGPEEPWSV